MIKPYSSAHKKELIEIFKKNIPSYFALKELAYFEDYLERFSETYCTIFDGNNIAGGIGFQISTAKNEGSITWVFLNPVAMNKGLGRTASEYCIERIKENKSITKIMVRTSQFAYLFFEKLGFKLIHKIDDYWAEGFDLFEMQLDI